MLISVVLPQPDTSTWNVGLNKSKKGIAQSSLQIHSRIQVLTYEPNHKSKISSPAFSFYSLILRHTCMHTLPMKLLPFPFRPVDYAETAQKDSQ